MSLESCEQDVHIDVPLKVVGRMRELQSTRYHVLLQ